MYIIVDLPLIFSVILVTFANALVDVLSACSVCGNFERVLRHFSLVLPPPSTDIKHYIKPDLVLETTWSRAIERVSWTLL